MFVCPAWPLAPSVRLLKLLVYLPSVLRVTIGTLRLPNALEIAPKDSIKLPMELVLAVIMHAYNASEERRLNVQNVPLGTTWKEETRVSQRARMAGTKIQPCLEHVRLVEDFALLAKERRYFALHARVINICSIMSAIILVPLATGTMTRVIYVLNVMSRV